MEYQVLGVPSQLNGRVHLEDFSNPAWKQLIRRHAHAFPEIHLVVRGAAVMLLRDLRIDLPSGSLLWVPPRTEHLTLETSESLRRWIVSVRVSAVRRALIKSDAAQLLSGRRGIACVQVSRNELLALDRLLLEVDESQGRNDSVTNAGLMYGLTRTMRAFREAQQTTDPTALHPAVARALHLMRGDGLILTRDELAERCGLSATHLSRLFIRELGHSLREMRNRKRLARFQHLLDSGECESLTEAALEAGFGSYSQFHRVHRRILGRSPTSPGA